MESLLSHHADPDTLKLWANLRLSYTETQGLPALRQEIASVYNSDEITADHVLCFAGAEEGIFCTLRTILKPTDHAIVLTPCYQSLLSVTEALCSVSNCPLLPQSGWKLDFTRLESLIQSNTKLLVMNFPHNPTGTVLSLEEQASLLRLAAAHDLWVICDEVYRGLERQHQQDVCFPLASVYTKGISIGAVSKSYGLAGLRIGWIAMQNKEMLQAIAGSKHYLSICNSGPSEILALVAVRARHAIWYANAEIIASNLVLIREFLAKYPDNFSWTEPPAACCGFMRVKGLKRDFAEVANKLAEETGLLLLPGGMFPASQEVVEGTLTHRQVVDQHMRVGFGRRNFPAALLALEEALPELLA